MLKYVDVCWVVPISNGFCQCVLINVNICVLKDAGICWNMSTELVRKWCPTCQDMFKYGGIVSKHYWIVVTWLESFWHMLIVSTSGEICCFMFNISTTDWRCWLVLNNGGPLLKYMAVCWSMLTSVQSAGICWVMSTSVELCGDMYTHVETCRCLSKLWQHILTYGDTCWSSVKCE